MPPEMQWVVQLGAVGGLVLLLTALRIGWLATRQEVTATSQQVEAWRERTKRAEAQVDTLLPAIEKLTAAILERGKLAQ
jgi:hypothetical protein